MQRGSNAVVASSAGKKPPVEEPPVRAQLARNGLTWQEGASSGYRVREDGADKRCEMRGNLSFQIEA